MARGKKEMPSLETIILAQSLNTIKDKERLKRTVRTLKDAARFAAGGRRVSPARLEAAQQFCLEHLEELNALRPPGPSGCSGGRVRQELPVHLL
jgi:hypothetical protein